jgi:hypothetical protein
MPWIKGDPAVSTHGREIQLLACGYSVHCNVRGGRVRATILARYTDGQGRPLRQRELRERHAAWLKANRPNVQDLRSESNA